MKRVLTALSLLLVMAMLLLPVTAFAAYTEGVHTVVDGDVTYTVYAHDDGTANLADIVIAETVTEPIDLVIPASFTIDGETYTVTAVSAISRWKTGSGEESYDQYEKIKSVSFEAEVLPVIQGNLFEYENRVPSATYFPNEPTNGTVASREYPTIPGFVSNNYNHDSNGDGTNDTYYAGANLVRVDPAYEGDLAVKDGTVSILAGAFWGCSKLEDVTIPDSVEWIGISAFAHSSVTTVNIPLGLMNKGNRIEPWVFQNCENLTTVTFPEDAEKKIMLAYFSFAGCSALEGFDFSHVSTIETCAFAYAFAQGAEIDLGDAGYCTSYSYSDGTQYTSYHPATFFASGIGKVTLPNIVAEVTSWTFMNCEHLTEVIIPDNVLQIRRSAFENCSSLAGDVLANTKVQFIDYRSFANNAMTVLTIPETVTSIAGGAFAGNEQLETINWKAGNLNSTLFSMLNDCDKGSYFPVPYAPARSADTWEEYTGLKTLNIHALPANPSVFLGLEFVETVNILCDVTALNSGNFKFCPSLKTITFSAPEKLTFIGENVFEGCLSLENFPFEEIVNVTRIGGRAFFLTPNNSDSGIGAVNSTAYAALSDTRKSWGLKGELDLSACTKLESLGDSAFYNQYNVTKVHLPQSLVGWPSNFGAFQGMPNLKELILEGDAPSNLMYIQFFAGERNAEKNTFHEGLETITIYGQAPMGGPSFFSMPKLKTVNLPNATTLPANAFMDCTALTTVNAPALTNIGEHAFMNCTSLTSFTLKAGVIYGRNLFMNCTGLTEVIAEEGVTVIPAGMFMNCTALTSVTAPDVTEVGAMAFANTGLTELVIKADVSYGDYAFQNCAKLTTVVVEEGVIELPNFILEGTSSLEELSLPETLKVIGWAALKNSGLEQVYIPACVVVIHDDAFRGSAKAVVMDGAPAILDEYSEDYAHLMVEVDNDQYAIDANATIYYANDDAKTAAEVYAQSVNLTDLAIEPYGCLVLEAQLDAEKILAGEALTGLTVTLNGEALTGEQYSVDYDPTDATLGERTVTVTLTDESLKNNSVVPGQAAATGFDGQRVTGEIVNVFDADSICDTVTVTVVDHLEHVFDIPGDQLAKAATCVAPAEYYAKCSFEGCNVHSDEIILPKGDVDPDNHIGEQVWTCDESNHMKTYECCGAAIESTEAPHDWEDSICKDCQYACEHGKDENNDHDCDYCGKALSECADTDKNHKCDLCGAELSQCADTDKNHKCDLCGAELSECADTDKNHKCDLCGAELSECADADKDHKCDICGKELSKCADADKDHNCDVCGKVLSECVDADKDYKCDICGKDLEKPEDPTDPEQPEKPVIEDVIRLAGANRWETSLKVADEMKANLGLEKFDAIIIASGNDFADALAGSYLSTVKNAPILLGWGKGGKYVTLDEANIAYIKANLAEGGTVYILGGKNAVPELYETELKGFKVVRLGGANRFETNLLILEEAGVDEGAEILVCTSTNFADSLSASATAKPILLVFNEYGKLYGKQPEFLAGLKNCTFTVIGGESAVSADLAKAIEAYGKVERLAGANRFETSVLVAQKYFASPETAVLAYAWNYPDGLCGGSLAFSLKAPLILTMTKYEAKAVEYAKNAGIEIGLVLGGDTLISDDAVRAIFAMDKADEIVVK